MNKNPHNSVPCRVLYSVRLINRLGMEWFLEAIYVRFFLLPWELRHFERINSRQKYIQTLFLTQTHTRELFQYVEQLICGWGHVKTKDQKKSPRTARSAVVWIGQRPPGMGPAVGGHRTCCSLNSGDRSQVWGLVTEEGKVFHTQLSSRFKILVMESRKPRLLTSSLSPTKKF